MSSYLAGNIYELVDGKYLVLKSVKEQAEAGTLVHILAAAEDPNGGFNVGYRVTETNQSFVQTFATLKDFYKWARPDTFIARNYDSFSKTDIQKYIKVKMRTPSSFCLPIIVVLLVIIWAALILSPIKLPINIILGVLLSVAAVIGVFYMYKKQKKSMKSRMYNKLTEKWGIKIQR